MRRYLIYRNIRKRAVYSKICGCFACAVHVIGLIKLKFSIIFGNLQKGVFKSDIHRYLAYTISVTVLHVRQEYCVPGKNVIHCVPGKNVIHCVPGKNVILPYKLSAQVMKINLKSEQIRGIFLLLLYFWFQV